MADAGSIPHLHTRAQFTRNPAVKEELEHNNQDGGAELMGRVVALMDDLFFQMKLAETAKQVGVEVKVAANGDALLGLMERQPKLVIVDLNARSQPLQVIEKLRQSSKDIRVVGFLSHVQTDLAAQARAAGCDEVLPRSSFTQNLAAILSVAKD
jgi:CheY-like chemotaxis protein